jgi:hypothetical protein
VLPKTWQMDALLRAVSLVDSSISDPFHGGQLVNRSLNLFTS